jgi:hypothetical protein
VSQTHPPAQLDHVAQKRTTISPTSIMNSTTYLPKTEKTGQKHALLFSFYSLVNA